MLNWKTILVPTDFSEGSRQALRIASELAQAHSAKLHILHVTELPPGLDTGTMIAPAPGGIPVTIVDFAREQALAWMNQDRDNFVTKGLDADTVYYKHALRPASLPFVTMLAGLLPSLFGGSVVFEAIFSWPGLGRWVFEAVFSRDLYIVVSSLFIGSALTLIGILISDILLSVADPRVRLS